MSGRRKPMPMIDRHKDLGPLHDLLLKVCVPEKKTRKKSITVLAKQIDFTPWGIYLWIKKGRVPAGRAKTLVGNHERYAKSVGGLPPKERVTLRDFDPYVYSV